MFFFLSFFVFPTNERFNSIVDFHGRAWKGEEKKEKGKRKNEAPWPGRNEVKRRVSNAWGGDGFFAVVRFEDEKSHENVGRTGASSIISAYL